MISSVFLEEDMWLTNQLNCDYIDKKIFHKDNFNYYNQIKYIINDCLDQYYPFFKDLLFQKFPNINRPLYPADFNNNIYYYHLCHFILRTIKIKYRNNKKFLFYIKKKQWSKDQYYFYQNGKQITIPSFKELIEYLTAQCITEVLIRRKKNFCIFTVNLMSIKLTMQNIEEQVNINNQDKYYNDLELNITDNNISYNYKNETNDNYTHIIKKLQQYSNTTYKLANPTENNNNNNTINFNFLTRKSIISFVSLGYFIIIVYLINENISLNKILNLEQEECNSQII